jgi:hypothetical protein
MHHLRCRSCCPTREDGRVSESQSVLGVGLIFSGVIYALFATIDLPIITGGAGRLPPPVRDAHEALASAFSTKGNSLGRATAEFLAIVAFTQLIPLIILASPGYPGALRIGSVIELAIAVAWTAFLVVASVGSD